MTLQLKKLGRLPLRRPVLFGLGLLALGQILYFFGFTTLYVLAAIYLLATCLPYPAMLRSLLSRVIAASLLFFSLLQVAAVVQFFAFPTTGFTVLSVISFLGITALVLTLGPRAVRAEKIWDIQDKAAMVAVLMFVVPFALLCFWRNDPIHILAFTSRQSPDGSSHFIAVSEMSGTQHLNYRTVQYYPKGFHLASAFVQHGFHANQYELNWAANARFYIVTYLLWGSITAYILLYVVFHCMRSLIAKRQLPHILVAISIGPVLALLYLFPFAYEGFINFYYICAAVLLGILFMYDYRPRQTVDKWFISAYLLLVFGVSMSWGPLLAPALLLTPLLYVFADATHPKQLWTWFIDKTQRWLVLAFAIQLVPLYLHVKYAQLSSQQGLTATGGITAFHFGIVLLGIAVLLYVVCAKQIATELRNLAINVCLPLYALVGFLMSLQYFAVGELRYYAIKTSFLLELIILTLSVALCLAILLRSSLTTLQRWLIAPLLVSMSAILLIGVTANPFAQTRLMFKDIVHIGNTEAYEPDIRQFTTLGLRGELNSTNTADLHLDANGALGGNALLPNWANLMQHTTDGTPEAGLCSGRIFAAQVYGIGQPSPREALIQSVKDCIVQAQLRHRPYYIVTDKHSVEGLRRLFGDQVTYLY